MANVSFDEQASPTLLFSPARIFWAIVW